MAKKALLVGINDYAPIGAGGADLKGCVNDVKLVATTLVNLNIVPALPANLKIITNNNATRNNIIKGVQWLIQGAKKGDVLIFHYSGHGSQMINQVNDDAEPDGKDETICPHDYATAGQIRDDDLRRIFANLPAGVNLDVILDSCHSGTATRFVPQINGNYDEINAITPRYIEPPLDVSFFLEENPLLRTRGFLRTVSPSDREREGSKDAVVVPNLNHVLWAGCRDSQTSGEGWIAAEKKTHGYFTYCYCKSLQKLGVTVTRRKLDAAITAKLKTYSTQVPQLEGTKQSIDEKVFT
ncbi:MAG: caspase family protein [Chitinivibrionales bacterium]|nr:caspase family protein [Chitinivibrionales bacterium]